MWAGDVVAAWEIPGGHTGERWAIAAGRDLLRVKQAGAYHSDQKAENCADRRAYCPLGVAQKHTGTCEHPDWSKAETLGHLAPRPCRFPRQPIFEREPISSADESARASPATPPESSTSPKTANLASLKRPAPAARPLTQNCSQRPSEPPDTLPVGKYWVHRLDDVKQRAPHPDVKTATPRMPVRACFCRAFPNTLHRSNASTNPPVWS